MTYFYIKIPVLFRPISSCYSRSQQSPTNYSVNGSTTSWQSSHRTQDEINWQPGHRTYPHYLIQDCLPAHTLQSSDKLLLTVPLMALALSAIAFSVSTPSVWNSLSYNCKSAELVSTFKFSLKTELFDIAYSRREHSVSAIVCL